MNLSPQMSQQVDSSLPMISLRLRPMVGFFQQKNAPPLLSTAAATAPTVA